MVIDPLTVTILNRQGILLEEKANSLSSFNDKGKFDILPQHANFISLIREKVSFRLVNGAVREIPVNNGIIRVRDNKVQVYIGFKK